MYTFRTLGAAGIIKPRIYLRSNFIRTFLKGSAVFSDITRMDIKY